eukprot:3878880-Prymnesium_polylepis.1
MGTGPQPIRPLNVAYGKCVYPMPEAPQGQPQGRVAPEYRLMAHHRPHTPRACVSARQLRRGLCVCVSARALIRSGNPDWLPDSAGRVAGSPRRRGKCDLNREEHAGARASFKHVRST